jgi:hypothetical protein
MIQRIGWVSPWSNLSRQLKISRPTVLLQPQDKRTGGGRQEPERLRGAIAGTRVTTLAWPKLEFDRRNVMHKQKGRVWIAAHRQSRPAVPWPRRGAVLRRRRAPVSYSHSHCCTLRSNSPRRTINTPARRFRSAQRMLSEGDGGYHLRRLPARCSGASSDVEVDGESQLGAACYL